MPEAGERTIWGIHMEWDRGNTDPNAKEIAIGWHEIGNLSGIAPNRDAFKAAFVKAYPAKKPGAVPVEAGVLYRFTREMAVGNVIVYPSKFDKTVNIGIVSGDYMFLPGANIEYPHRRKVEWKTHTPRPQFSQPALNEIGSAITLFQISTNAEEFLATLEGKPFNPADIDDATTAAEIAVQVEENVEDFIIKQLKNTLSPDQFEFFIAELLRCMGYFARVTPYKGDGGVDIIAHKDELGFEGPVVKVQCKQTLSPIGGPPVQQLLGAIQTGENALFVTLGEYTSDAIRIERGKPNLRLIGRADLIKLIFNNYEKFDPRFKTLLPLKRTYTPSTITTD